MTNKEKKKCLECGQELVIVAENADKNTPRCMGCGQPTLDPLTSLLQSAEEAFDNRFYEGKRNSVYCREHNIFASPFEIKKLLRSKLTEAFNKGKEMR